MSIENSVLEKLLRLPVEKQKEVLDFVDSIWRQHRDLKTAKEAEVSKSEHATYCPRSHWCRGTFG